MSFDTSEFFGLPEISDQTIYNPPKKKYVSLWILDTSTVTVTHFYVDTLNVESKTYYIDLIR